MINDMSGAVGKNEYVLTVIVPITRMAGKLHNLKAWINSAIGTASKIILVHDFQDLETSKELACFIESMKSNQITFIERYFGSPGLARNAGLEKLDTEWCCFWDSDDIPNLKDTLEGIANARSATDVLIYNFECQGTDQIKFVDHYSSLDQVALNPGLWRMVFKSKYFLEKKFLDLCMGEDQIFLLDINLAKGNLEFCKKTNYIYMTANQGQLTRDPNLNSLKALYCIQQSVADSNYAIDRFLTIVYARLLFSSIKRLKLRYPMFLLFKNTFFVARLNLNAFVFFLGSKIVHLNHFGSARLGKV